MPLALQEKVQQRPARPAAGPTPAPHRAVHDAAHTTTLPGALVRAEGGAADRRPGRRPTPTTSLGATWQLYWQAYQRDSLDGGACRSSRRCTTASSYDNAFWNGTQMVFGDGDGVYFNRFTDASTSSATSSPTASPQFTAGLTYVGQSGALNESVSDVFGSLVKQMHLGQTAQDADWLIGDRLFTSKVHGVALRSMKAPGTAYDDPVLGKDPQPADMDGYVDLPHDDQHDSGGVHTNSGIPTTPSTWPPPRIGGNAWEAAGQVWYDVLTAPGLAKDVGFAGFAAATVEAAAARFGAGSTRGRGGAAGVADGEGAGLTRSPRPRRPGQKPRRCSCLGSRCQSLATLTCRSR